MYKEYVTPQDVCDVLCPYKIGDIVTLLTDKSTEKGMYEAGTSMIIKEIELNSSIKCPKVFKEELSEYTAAERLFMLTLELPNTTPLDEDISLRCRADNVVIGEVSKQDVIDICKKRNKPDWILIIGCIVGMATLVGTIISMIIVNYTLLAILFIVGLIFTKTVNLYVDKDKSIRKKNRFF